MRLKRFVGRWKWVQENTLCFFFQAEDGIRDVAVTGVQTCALPILGFDKLSGVARPQNERDNPFRGGKQLGTLEFKGESQAPLDTMIGASLDARQFSDLSRLRPEQLVTNRKSTRLNSSHGYISYAVFCLKKKNKNDRKPFLAEVKQEEGHVVLAGAVAARAHNKLCSFDLLVVT